MRMSAPNGGAVISDDQLYRYKLWREWNVFKGSCMVFLMLNPSTADAITDDPTIRRCQGFAIRNGCGSMEVVNLYALRCTKPEHLRDHPDPEGPDNPLWWASAIYDNPRMEKIIVAAWGAHDRSDLPESKALRGFCEKAFCLGTTKAGHPRHPLYVHHETPLIDCVIS